MRPSHRRVFLPRHRFEGRDRRSILPLDEQSLGRDPPPGVAVGERADELFRLFLAEGGTGAPLRPPLYPPPSAGGGYRGGHDAPDAAAAAALQVELLFHVVRQRQRRLDHLAVEIEEIDRSIGT